MVTNKMLKNLFAIILISGAFSSCSPPSPTHAKLEAEYSYKPKYAKFFRIDYYEHYKKIMIINPWDKQIMNFEYFLATDSTKLPVSTKNSSFQIQQIPKSAVALSSPLVGMLNTLEMGHLIKGLTDPYLIYDSLTAAKVASGEIENIGKSIQINMEKLIMLNPDIIIGSGWDQMSADYEKMIKLKMTPVFMYDWRELHPLGKAEWMVLLAAFFDEEEKAKQLFTEIENRYHNMKESLGNKKKPVVFNGSEYQGIWYSAGGKSYLSQLYIDAGAIYLMENDSSQGSIKLDFEVLMDKAANTPIWMYTGGIGPNHTALFSSPKYANFEAIKKHQVYSYHKRMRTNGANDYWETGGLRPDLVLQDLIGIFHQKKGEDLDLYYFDVVKY